MMHGRGKSDTAIVAWKPTNKADLSAAESVEPRAGTKGNADQQSTRRAQDRGKRVRSATLLGAGGLVPDVVGDGRGRHGEARFAGGGRSYD